MTRYCCGLPLNLNSTTIMKILYGVYSQLWLYNKSVKASSHFTLTIKAVLKRRGFKPIIFGNFCYSVRPPFSITPLQ